MRKASNILFIIALVLTAVSLTFLVASCVWSFMISAPGYKEEIIKGLQSGAITPLDPALSYEENASNIQSIFLVIALISLFLFIASASKGVVLSIAKKRHLTYMYIISMALGLVTGDVLSIMAPIFGLVANRQEEEEITINY